MLLKLALCLCALVLVHTKDVGELPKLKTFHNDFFDRHIERNPELIENVQGAVVLKSNLPLAVQNRLAANLTSIYQRISDPLQRAQQFQTVLSQTYSVYWSVVVNFDVITFYSQYYILLQINSDRVLGFGLS